MKKACQIKPRSVSFGKVVKYKKSKLFDHGILMKSGPSLLSIPFNSSLTIVRPHRSRSRLRGSSPRMRRIFFVNYK